MSINRTMVSENSSIYPFRNERILQALFDHAFLHHHAACDALAITQAKDRPHNPRRPYYTLIWTAAWQKTHTGGTRSSPPNCKTKPLSLRKLKAANNRLCAERHDRHLFSAMDEILYELQVQVQTYECDVHGCGSTSCRNA